MRSSFSLPVLVLLVFAGCNPAAHGATAYAISSGNVLTFQTGNPSVRQNDVPLQGIPVGQEVTGLDRRPANGLLYLLTLDLSNTARLYTLNPANGAATFAVALNQPVSGGVSAMDFDPVTDRLRMIAAGVQNLQANPVTGEVTADTSIDWASGDPNEALFPAILSVAYANNLPGSATTSLYAIDNGADALVRVDPINGGVLRTVGSLGVDIGGATSFDVAPSPVNHAFAALPVSGPLGLETDLFLIDLATGHASGLGRIAGGTLDGFCLGGDYPHTAFSRNQNIRIVTGGEGYQELSFNYETGEIFVTPFRNTTGGVPRLFPFVEWTGVFHYDYGAAAYTQAVYSRQHPL